MMSDILNGKEADIQTHSNVDDIKVGDTIRFTDILHSAVIIGVDQESITLLEVNGDYRTCKIQWGRVIQKDRLEEFIIFSRNSNMTH